VRQSLRALAASGVIAATASCPVAAGGLPLERLILPPGFRISIYADGVTDARSLALGANGTVFVGTRRDGRVYALPDRDGDQRADSVITIANGLRMPNGVAFLEGALYVALNDRLLRFDNIEARLDRPPAPVVVNTSFPTEQHHGWRYLRTGPDGRLYVSIGAPCNVCDAPGFAVIERLNRDGTGREVIARGVRNSVGFDWHPQTGELWFTDNGRDRLGDDVPADEVNRLAQPGADFGFPYCHGGNVRDPEFGENRSCSEATAPAWRLPAHVAPLGMRFYTGKMFPAEWGGRLFVAEHGSWNRSVPDGYRVVALSLSGNQVTGAVPFVQGWLGADGRAWGRPVDLLVMPDGALLLSDDRAGVVYRIDYKNNE